MTNGNEWLALTDPGDPASFLRITSLVRNGNDLQFTFPSVLGRNYTFEQSTDLVYVDHRQPAPSPAPAARSSSIYPNVFTGNPKFFFRARVGP